MGAGGLLAFGYPRRIHLVGEEGLDSVGSGVLSVGHGIQLLCIGQCDFRDIVGE